MHVSTIKKIVKQQFPLHMSSQYGELRDRLARLGHSSKFQWVSHLGFVTAPTSHNWGQQNFGRCSAVSWVVHYIYVSRVSCLVTEFCQVQNSLCVQVLRSPLSAALLQGTPAAGVTQTLRSGRRNRNTEFSLLVILNRVRHLYSEGGHHVGHMPTF